jgi:hypothetical protein
VTSVQTYSVIKCYKSTNTVRKTWTTIFLVAIPRNVKSTKTHINKKKKKKVFQKWNFRFSQWYQGENFLGMHIVSHLRKPHIHFKHIYELRWNKISNTFLPRIQKHHKSFTMNMMAKSLIQNQMMTPAAQCLNTYNSKILNK